MAEQGTERSKPTTDFLMRMKAEGSKIVPTIERFTRVLEENYDGIIRLNEMTGKVEYCADGESWREWTDAQESGLRSWFQSSIGMYNAPMMQDAMNVFFESRKANPLLEILNSLQWDGVQRMEHFLHEVARVPDDRYHREVSRLLFAGGVWRAFKPGCKFDDVVVLTGSQGSGKSTIVRLLNMDDEYFREIKIITGKEGIEGLRGAWIAEMAELMAMTRVKETETVKAFITTQADSYRPPYARNVITIPRRCIFIGTTNNCQFLTDRTGNRRFYPVNVQSSGRDILRRETEIREYIRQCWAEAVALYKAGKLQPFASFDLIDIFRQQQEGAMEDDWRIGAIEQYLMINKPRIGDTVSVIELWHRALNEPEESKPQRKDSIEITQIMLQMANWERAQRPMRSPIWGLQRVFVKISPENLIKEEVVTAR